MRQPIMYYRFYVPRGAPYPPSPLRFGTPAFTLTFLCGPFPVREYAGERYKKHILLFYFLYFFLKDFDIHGGKFRFVINVKEVDMALNF